jgi:peroxiredoxin
MKKTIPVLLICFYAILGQAQSNVTINASIKGLAPGQWVYWFPLNDSRNIDSVKTTPGGFQTKIAIPDGEGDAYMIRIGKKYVEGSAVLFYLDKGTVTIKGNGPLFTDVTLSGSQYILDYNAYTDFIKNDPQLKGRTELYKKANELYAKKDSAGYAALRPELERMDSVDKTLTKQWILNHKTSPVSAFLLSFELGRLDIDEKETILNKLSPVAKNNAPAKRIAYSIRVNNLTGIGKTAMNFIQNDTLGKPISLNNFRGKYVLIDFWASWCVPCRAENPNVVAAFHKYKDKNFTIVSVSLDQPDGKDKWLNAIHADHLTWTHVSDLKFWNNAVAKQYDIRSIPANFLIDPQGKIIAKNLRKEALDKKLKEVL